MYGDIEQKRVDDMAEFTQYQISASEALRAAGMPGLSKSRRITLFSEAEKWATKAFLAAGENMYSRYLAICQMTCAAGSIMMTEQDYLSEVVHAADPESVEVKHHDDSE